MDQIGEVKMGDFPDDICVPPVILAIACGSVGWGVIAGLFWLFENVTIVVN